ncbi:zinc finger Y-chromosomal protein 1 isoform X1 [Eurytemora carolleeae]|uniref:zinc finger Y-chromosomal protein 1 isoform X1 n=2 Tax=Eurytemora carolleeae TaxID=1294199 RepID=UPI000C758890|nr:zinc finger Y-chromosomal protein 1 isoform X1 [Eurytemora carolleeae]|eukprot:XP_023349595.1 zinc finger Y-chromosomal protein 1-like isoform X1 [Eurytemora affinis]
MKKIRIKKNIRRKIETGFFEDNVTKADIRIKLSCVQTSIFSLLRGLDKVEKGMSLDYVNFLKTFQTQTETEAIAIGSIQNTLLSLEDLKLDWRTTLVSMQNLISELLAGIHPDLEIQPDELVQPDVDMQPDQEMPPDLVLKNLIPNGVKSVKSNIRELESEYLSGPGLKMCYENPVKSEKTTEESGREDQEYNSEKDFIFQTEEQDEISTDMKLLEMKLKEELPDEYFNDFQSKSVIPGEEMSCDLCDFKSNLVQRIQIHKLTTHQVNKKEICEDCGSQFGGKKALKHHKERMHYGVRYPCDQCKYKATDKSHLRRHKQRVHQGLKHPCELCGQFYSDMSTLKRHIKNIHVQQKVYICDQCGFKAMDSISLDRHKINAHEKNLPEIRCTECDYITHFRNKLTKHVQIAHKGVRFPCTQCDYKATEKSHLRRHIQSIHEKIKYDCDKCEYKASEPGNLKNHKKRIHGDVFDNCSLCSFIGKSASELKRHEFLVHDKVDFCCDKCSYECESQEELKMHKVSLHRNIYLCDQCDYKSHQLSNLSRHKKSIHPIS